MSDDAPTYWFVAGGNDDIPDERIYQKLIPLDMYGLDLETAKDVRDELNEVIERVENDD